MFVISTGASVIFVSGQRMSCGISRRYVCVIGVCSQMVSGGCLYMGVVVWAVSMSAVLSLEGNL